MSRKMLVKGMVLTLCLALIPFFAGSVHAQKPIELAFALHTAPGGPDHAAVQKFKEMVESHSKNRLKVNPFPGAQLGGERDNLEQLKQGKVALTQSLLVILFGLGVWFRRHSRKRSIQMMFGK